MKLKDADLAPIITVHFITLDGLIKCKTLVDSGASDTVLDWDKAKHFSIETANRSHKLTTVMGSITNKQYAQVKFKLPQFSPTMIVDWKCDVIQDMSRLPYDMIIGRDAMTKLNLDVLASDKTVTMNHVKIPWMDRNAKTSSLFNTEEEELSNEDDSGDRIKKILDAKYEAADLERW